MFHHAWTGDQDPGVDSHRHPAILRHMAGIDHPQCSMRVAFGQPLGYDRYYVEILTVECVEVNRF